MDLALWLISLVYPYFAYFPIKENNMPSHKISLVMYISGLVSGGYACTSISIPNSSATDIAEYILGLVLVGVD